MYRYVIKAFRLHDEVPKEAVFMSSLPSKVDLFLNGMGNDNHTDVERPTTNYAESGGEIIAPENVIHYFLVRERIETPVKDELKELDEEGLIVE